jgi:2-polyprenyl-6-methoxyphenol hydroxylase-like FAD-dependent oxidoreductase
LLCAVGKKGIFVVCDSRLVSIGDKKGEKVIAVFTDGKEVSSNFILGCGGLHSSIRTSYIELSRIFAYTNVAVAYFVIDGRAGVNVHFHQTVMNSGRFGSPLTLFVKPEGAKIYLSTGIRRKRRMINKGGRLEGISNKDN